MSHLLYHLYFSICKPICFVWMYLLECSQLLQHSFASPLPLLRQHSGLLLQLLPDGHAHTRCFLGSTRLLRRPSLLMAGCENAVDVTASSSASQRLAHLHRLQCCQSFSNCCAHLTWQSRCRQHHAGREHETTPAWQFAAVACISCI